jgi:hypothetical protein
VNVFARRSAPPPATAADIARTSLTASAQRVNLTERPPDATVAKRRWQSDAWYYYDAIPEIKYAYNLLANLTSRVRLYPAMVTDMSARPTQLTDLPTAPPPPGTRQPPTRRTVSAPVVPPDLVSDAVTLTSRLSAMNGGQTALMRELALNLSVTGECWLVQMNPEPFTDNPYRSREEETWNVFSVDELSFSPSSANGAGGMTAMIAQGPQTNGSSANSRAANAFPLPEDAFIGRIWRPHPRFGSEPDSSMSSVIELCSDLLLLNRALRATAQSRLNAGAFFVPDGLSASYEPTPPASSTEPVPPAEDHDEFEEELLAAMTTPISDPGSAAAVVPMLIRGPADLGEKMNLLKFERSFDPALAERADKTLERILQGLDIPKDMVTGLANIRFNNATRIEESFFKGHIEPLAVLIADALTMLWLRPALLKLGHPEDIVRRTVIWYDASDIVMRPDRSDAADAGYDRNLISGSAWREAYGFSESDSPDPVEIAFRILMQKGQILPETAELLFEYFAPGILHPEVPPGAPPGTPAAQPGAAPPGAEGLPEEVARALGRPPSSAAPSQPAAPAAAPPTQTPGSTEPVNPDENPLPQ